jgi:hypothetical protein
MPAARQLLVLRRHNDLMASSSFLTSAAATNPFFQREDCKTQMETAVSLLEMYRDGVVQAQNRLDFLIEKLDRIFSGRELKFNLTSQRCAANLNQVKEACIEHFSIV